MATYKLSVLVSGTEFSYQSKKYVIGMSNTNSNYEPEFLGVQPKTDELVYLKECHPILGGKVQVGIKICFNKDTEVEIY